MFKVMEKVVVIMMLTEMGTETVVKGVFRMFVIVVVAVVMMMVFVIGVVVGNGDGDGNGYVNCDTHTVDGDHDVTRKKV